MTDIILPSLFPHQAEHVDRTRAALARHRRVIMCGPTGSGKTREAKYILGSSLNRTPTTQQSGRSLFCVHRRGLVVNAEDSFAEEPALSHGTIMSGRDTAYGNRIQVGSIDTLLAWFCEDDAYQNDLTFDLIIYDETHAHLPKFARFLQLHDAKREELGLNISYVIGLSATPQARGLADVYKEIVQGPTTQWLIDEGFLSKFKYFRATQGRLDKLVKRGGEFTKSSVCEAMEGLAGDLVRDWKKFGEGRPTLGFFPRRSHAKDAMAELIDAGLRVEYVDGLTPDDERKSIFRRLNEHRIDYLCNVQVVERGTDIPAIQCIQLCTCTASLIRKRQMVGRGARVHPGKTDCVVIDHGNNIKNEEDFFEVDPEWSLDITTKDPGEVGTRPTIECPKCNAIYRGGKCAHCGYEPTPKERRGQGLEFDGSELKEVKRPEKKASVKTAEQIMVSCLYAAGRSGRTWRQACGMFRGACTKQGSNYRVPKNVTVGEHRYEMLRFGSDDNNRRVSVLFPFVDGGEHGGKYLVEAQEATASLF